MAAGNILAQFNPQAAEFPGTAFPTFDTRNLHVVLDFDAATDEGCYFKGCLPWHYGGGGITVYIDFAMTSADSGAVVWGVAFERNSDGQGEIAADSFATAKTVTKSVNATPDRLDRASIAFADNEIDGLLAGEGFRIRVYRDADAGADTATGDAELWQVVLRETP